ncbi:hypothetical protein PT974_06112 [Cladobotryum mycophilum]|uniref:Protein phosphatase 4 core regulatory subunit R2 n=1 Tax=Cladobotryum mycophilum TaxID=491253 RepID=A0ABR0SKM2_9HYPO
MAVAALSTLNSGRIPPSRNTHVDSMDVDVDNDVLGKIAGGELIELPSWPALRSDILARLDKIAHDEFPIPKLPASALLPLSDRLLVSPLPSSTVEPSSEDTSKENAPESQPSENATQDPEPGALPKPIDDMLSNIKSKIESFDPYPPHTLQRLAELLLKPRAHYKALATYLHAVDRVVQVTSGTDTYPLPPSVPDMSSMRLNGEDPKDPALQVSWSNPTTAAVGSDEALGGALLTPIPWLTRRSPEGPAPGAQIHSEGTETIDGPNGMGSIETVSVSVNGVPSTGHARGVTQGELLRQEQRAGVVPVSQLTRTHDLATENGRPPHAADEGSRMEEDEEEVPHARGPEAIGVNDTGPQTATTSYVGESGVDMQGIDLEAAVGRKHEEPAEAAQSEADDAAPKSPSAESVGSKREAEETPEDDSAAKKVKEDTLMEDSEKPSALPEKPATEGEQPEATEPEAKAETKEADDNADKMETTEET